MEGSPLASLYNRIQYPSNHFNTGYQLTSPSSLACYQRSVTSSNNSQISAGNFQYGDASGCLTSIKMTHSSKEETGYQPEYCALGRNYLAPEKTYFPVGEQKYHAPNSTCNDSCNDALLSQTVFDYYLTNSPCPPPNTYQLSAPNCATPSQYHGQHYLNFFDNTYQVAGVRREMNDDLGPY